MMPSISVIMPVKNSKAFIWECVNSILKQSYQDFELIIIDDGCLDETIPLIRSFGSDKINIVTNNGNGIADALNLGVESSRSDIICRMDSDDICSVSRLARQMGAFEKDPELDILGTKASYGTAPSTSVFLDSVLTHDEIKYSLLFQNPLVHSSVMFRKSSLLEKKIFYSTNFNGSEDYELWTRAMYNDLKFAVLNSTELFYRIHPAQFSQKGNTHINNLTIKSNYGKFIFGDLIDCGSIEYLQLMTREIIFVSESYIENITDLTWKLIVLCESQILKDYLHHNLRNIVNQIKR